MVPPTVPVGGTIVVSPFHVTMNFMISIAGPRQSRGRVAVIGDVGGHSHRLRRILEGLGVQFELPERSSPVGSEWGQVQVIWPADLHVVQVGDLIHRGPDSVGVLRFVDAALQEGLWTQVVGNHERQYLDRPMFTWHEVLPDESQKLLRHWWSAGAMAPAAAVIPAVGRAAVVTHAGLTWGFWRRELAEAPTAAAAVGALRKLAECGSPTLFEPGAMLGGAPNPYAGPVWAEASLEVYLPWLAAAEAGIECPFDQVHGHSTAFQWSGSKWLAPEMIRPALRVDTGRRHVTANVGEAVITGIDPTHLKYPSRVWHPFVFQDAHIVT